MRQTAVLPDDLLDGDEERRVVPLPVVQAACDLQLAIPLGPLADDRFQRRKRFEVAAGEGLRKLFGAAAAKDGRVLAHPPAAPFAVGTAGGQEPGRSADRGAHRQLDPKDRPIEPRAGLARRPVLADDLPVDAIDQQLRQDIESQNRGGSQVVHHDEVVLAEVHQHAERDPERRRQPRIAEVGPLRRGISSGSQREDRRGRHDRQEVPAFRRGDSEAQRARRRQDQQSGERRRQARRSNHPLG